MGVLSGRQIKREIQERNLVIDPFDEEMVQPASYDLRVGNKILASPLSPAILGAKIELDERLPSYDVQSGQMVSVLSLERLAFPLDICGRFGIVSSFSRRGINALGGVQLDPGWRGRLALNLLNVGPEAIRITRGDPFFSVEFQRLEEPAEEGYSGSYQDQDDFPPEQYEFILNARTTSLAEIPALRLELSRLNVVIDGLHVVVEELHEHLPDPDAGWELRPEIEERLRGSGGKLISIGEMRESLRRNA